jgi:hypothetical protein
MTLADVQPGHLRQNFGAQEAVLAEESPSGWCLWFVSFMLSFSRRLGFNPGHYVRRV